MTSSKMKAGVFSLLLSLLIFAATSAQACEAAETRNFITRYPKADVAFIGVVEEVDYKSKKVIYRILRGFKGVRAGDIYLANTASIPAKTGFLHECRSEKAGEVWGRLIFTPKDEWQREQTLSMTPSGYILKDEAGVDRDFSQQLSKEFEFDIEKEILNAHALEASDHSPDKNTLDRIERISAANATKGEMLAMLDLVKIYEGRKDYVMALKWLRVTADQGSILSQYKLGEYHETGRGTPMDVVEAASWYRMAAEFETHDFIASKYKARCALGKLYAHALGPELDYKKFADLFGEKSSEVGKRAVAASTGDASAQRSLAELFSFFSQCKIDILNAEQKKWLQAAAEKKNPEDLYRLAVLEGNRKNSFEALRLLTKAGEGGNVDAQLRLAGLYCRGSIFGNGVTAPIDMVSAISWYKRAAMQGDDRAQLDLGHLYSADSRSGIIFSQEIKDKFLNYEEAYFWYLLAASQGKITGGAARLSARDIERRLTGDEQEAVLKRVAQWKPVLEKNQ